MNLRCLALLSTLVWSACGSSSPSTSNPDGAVPADLASAAESPDLAGPGAHPAAVTGNVGVPASFSGTPRQLLVAAFDQFPPAGPPAGILYQGNPMLSAGHAVKVSGDGTGLSGTKYVLAVLYMQGGGQLQPMAGVDYVSAPVQVSFNGQPVDFGTLALMLLPGGDGGM